MQVQDHGIKWLSHCHSVKVLVELTIAAEVGSGQDMAKLSHNVLFADDTNILVSEANMNNFQYKLNNVMNELQTWFTLNSLVVNVEKMLAISFHTVQNKKPVLPHVIFEGRDIPYSTETKISGLIH